MGLQVSSQFSPIALSRKLLLPALAHERPEVDIVLRVVMKVYTTWFDLPLYSCRCSLSTSLWQLSLLSIRSESIKL